MTALSFIKAIQKRRLNSKISKLERELGIVSNGKTGSDKYWVNCEVNGGNVSINIMAGAFGGLLPGHSVSPPNFIESLLGITFEDKINTTLRNVQNSCDKMNKAESYANQAFIMSGVADARK